MRTGQGAWTGAAIAVALGATVVAGRSARADTIVPVNEIVDATSGPLAFDVNGDGQTDFSFSWISTGLVRFNGGQFVVDGHNYEDGAALGPDLRVLPIAENTVVDVTIVNGPIFSSGSPYSVGGALEGTALQTGIQASDWNSTDRFLVGQFFTADGSGSLMAWFDLTWAPDGSSMTINELGWGGTMINPTTDEIIPSETVASVPEPASIALAALGLLGVGARARRRTAR